MSLHARFTVIFSSFWITVSLCHYYENPTGQSQSNSDVFITKLQTCVSGAAVGYSQERVFSVIWKKSLIEKKKRKTEKPHAWILKAWRGANIEGCNVLGCERGFRSETQLCTTSCYALTQYAVCAPFSLFLEVDALVIPEEGQACRYFYEEKCSRNEETVTCRVIKHLPHLLHLYSSS